jgi:hypothetical protein
MDRTGEFERLLLDSVKSIGDQQTVELKTNKVDLSKRQPLTKEAYLIVKSIMFTIYYLFNE